MTKKESEYTTTLSVNNRGGEGTIEITDVLTSDELHGAGRFFGITVIPPHCSTGLHTHTGEFETYYILRGTAEYNDNGTLKILHPGECSQCGDGESHCIRNIGDTDLVYVAAILYTGESK